MEKFIALFLIVFVYIVPQKIYASQNADPKIIKLASAEIVVEKDNRVKILKSFLESYNSTLAPFAASFVKEADKNTLDWRILAAISGVESTFGKQILYDSYNAWGWGIYGDNAIYFKSWNQAIETISKGLRENYVNKLGTDDVYQIGGLYAASPTWAQRVVYFMNKIDEFAINNPKNTLSLSL